MLIHNIILDPDIIPDEKERLFKEAFELFRRACNLHEAIHLLSLAPTKNEKMKAIYALSIAHLEKERYEIIKNAIERYNMSQAEGKNELQPITESDNKS